MELSKTSAATPDRPVLAGGGDRRPASKIRVLYAGSTDVARVQFASEAPQLQLLTAAEASAASGPNGRSASGEQLVDVAFVDCGSPAVNAAAWLEDLRQQRPGLPVVLAVDPGVENAARMAVDLRADDYTVKSPGWLARLPVRLSIVIARHRHVAQLETVRANEQRLRTIVESAPVCFARVDRTGTILAMNNAARLMMGAARPADVLRKSVLSFVSDEDRDACQRFIELACADQAGSLEFSLCVPPAAVRRVEASANTVPASANVQATAVLVLRDVSLRKRLEESVLEKAEAEAAGPSNADASSADASSAAAEQALQLERSQRELGELQERYGQVLAERDGLLANVDQARVATRLLTERLQHQEGDRRQVEADRDELRRAIEQQRSEHQAAMTSALQVQNDLTRRLDDAAAESATVKAAQESVARSSQDWEAERDRLHAERDRLHSERDRLEAERDQLHTEGTRLQSERDAVQATLHERQHRHDADMAAALTARVDLERQLRAAEAAAQRAAEEAQEPVARQLQQWEAECRLLESERDALQSALDSRQKEYEADKASALHVRTDLQRRLVDAETRVVQAAIEAQESFGRQLHQLKIDYEHLESERNTLRTQLDGARTQHAADLAASRDSYQTLQVQLEDCDKARARACSERDELKGQLAHSNARHGERLADEISIRQVLELRLQHTETEYRRLTAERDESLKKVRERNHRREALVRAMLDSEQHEELAKRWISRCDHLEQMLEKARVEFQQLAEWARRPTDRRPAQDSQPER